MEFRKTVTTILYTGGKRDIEAKNRLLDYVGEGKAGIIWENSTETSILP